MDRPVQHLATLKVQQSRLHRCVLGSRYSALHLLRSIKYITKGADFVKASTLCGNDEIEAYRSARYISTAEAAWRLLGFHTMEGRPSVTPLRLHLPDEQQVIVDASLSRSEQRSAAASKKTDLLLYFGRPLDPIFDSLTYLDYFENYIVNSDRQSRQGRVFRDIHGSYVTPRSSDQHVARLTAFSPDISPDKGDVFYLRPLLHHKPSRSFEGIRYHNGTVYDTFQDAARAMGIVQHDEEYRICIQEAILFNTGRQLRQLFVTLILDGAPAKVLWEQFMSDFTHDLRMTLSDDDAVTAAFREIDLSLQYHGRTNHIVGLPTVVHLDTEYTRFKGMFKPVDMAAFAGEHLPNLTTEQRHVYDKVVDSAMSGSPNIFMIDAPASTGKTYTENAI